MYLAGLVLPDIGEFHATNDIEGQAHASMAGTVVSEQQEVSTRLPNSQIAGPDTIDKWRGVRGRQGNGRGAGKRVTQTDQRPTA